MLFSSIAYYTYLPLAANCEIALALFASHHHSGIMGLCVINIIGVEYFTRLSLSKLVVCASRGHLTGFGLDDARADVVSR